LEGITVQAVAAEAGCSAGAIAHYFRNKDELLVHALHAAMEALIEPLREPTEPLCTLDALRAVARGCLPLDTGRERDWRVRLAFWARASGPPEEVQLARQHLSEWRVLWEGAIRAVQAQGGVRADVDALAASAGVVALIVGTAAQLLVRPRPRPGAQQLADPLESYLRGLGPRHPQ